MIKEPHIILTEEDVKAIVKKYFNTERVELKYGIHQDEQFGNSENSICSVIARIDEKPERKS